MSDQKIWLHLPIDDDNDSTPEKDFDRRIKHFLDKNIGKINYKIIGKPIQNEKHFDVVLAVQNEEEWNKIYHPSEDEEIKQNIRKCSEVFTTVTAKIAPWVMCTNQELINDNSNEFKGSFHEFFEYEKKLQIDCGLEKEIELNINEDDSLNYFNKVKTKEIEQIEQKYKVSIRFKNKKILIRNLKTSKNTRDAEKDLIKLFQKTVDNLERHNEIKLPSDSSLSSVRSIIEIHNENPNLLVKGDLHKITVYGEEHEVKEAFKMIREELKIKATGGICEVGAIGSEVSSVDHQVSKLSYNNIFDFGTLKVEIRRGDLTKIHAEALVNASNETMQHYGGVALALLNAGGSIIQKESNEYIKANGKLKPSEVAITKPGKLNCMHIIHAVGPIWPYPNENKCQQLLKKTVKNVIDAANKQKLKTLAMPAISAGVYGVPKMLCAQKYYEAIADYSTIPGSVERIYIVDVDPYLISSFFNVFNASYNGSSNVQNIDQGYKKEVLLETIDCNDGYVDAKAPDITMYWNKTEITKICQICTDEVKLVQMDCCKLSQCCKKCLKRNFELNSKCPFCAKLLFIKNGNQPNGKMIIKKTDRSLQGYNCQTLILEYIFPSGLQVKGIHPNPGQCYESTTRRAYLPDNAEGREVLELIKEGFKRRLLFTIGTSQTTGKNNSIVWNDIHQKTSFTPNSEYGYPDKNYFQRVKAEMAEKGIKHPLN